MDKEKNLIWRDLTILLLLAGTLFMYHLGHGSLWDSDEPKYGEAAWEMVQSGNWLVPHFNQTERFDKPPLFYWCIAASYQVFGFNEFATRLPASIFGILTALITYFTGKMLFSQRIGLYSGIILAATLQFIIQSRLAVVDTTLTFFITAAIYGITGVCRYPSQFRYYLYTVLGIAFATLTKGPIGIFFPCIIGAAAFTLFNTWKKLNVKWVAAGIIIFIIISVPWYIMVLSLYGRIYTDNFFLFHNITRFLTPVDNQSGPWYYYFMTLPLGLFPWSVFIIPIIAQLFIPKSSNDEYNNSKRKTLYFLGFWVIIVFLFFSLAATKLPNYVLPLFPPYAILMGLLLTTPIKSRPLGTLITYSFIGTLLLTVIIGIVLPHILQQKHSFLTQNSFLGILPPVILLSLSILVPVFMLNKCKTFSNAFIIMALGLGIFFVWTSQIISPFVETHKPVKRLAITIMNNNLAQNDVIATYKIASTSLVYYTRHKVIPIDEDMELLQLIDGMNRVFILAPQKEYAEINNKYNLPLHVLKDDGAFLLLVKKNRINANKGSLQ